MAGSHSVHWRGKFHGQTTNSVQTFKMRFVKAKNGSYNMAWLLLWLMPTALAITEQHPCPILLLTPTSDNKKKTHGITLNPNQERQLVPPFLEARH